MNQECPVFTSGSFILKNDDLSICRIRMQLIVRSLTTHVLDVSPDANVEVAVLYSTS
jgi:hypothetical protein